MFYNLIFMILSFTFYDLWRHGVKKIIAGEIDWKLDTIYDKTTFLMNMTIFGNIIEDYRNFILTVWRKLR